MKKTRIGQLNFKVGDIDGNKEKIIQAANSGEGLIVFTEMCITGYSSEDLWLRPGFIKKEQEALQEIAKRAKQPIILGASQPVEDKLYNAAYHINGGKAEVVAHKCNLPNYGVFDERRYFYGDNFLKILPDGTGVLVCEDAWKMGRIDDVKKAGAKRIISINASPYEFDKYKQRHELARNSGVPFLYVNNVGGQDDVVFDGGSFVLNEGQILAAPVFEEFVGVATKPFAALSKEESNYKAMCLGVRDYVQKNGFKKVLLGVSGGVDSAVVAAIAVDALGKENVRGVILPSKYSSKVTMEDAYAVCKSLGIWHEEHTIWDNYKAESGLTAENMQSRIRGIMLMALSNKHNELLLTTGNKSEIATGYCTIYGDMNGAYNPVKDLYKTELYAVAKWLGNLPPRVLSKAPTAELRENQTDQDSLPPYDILDGILRQLVEERKIAEEVGGYDAATVKKVERLLKISEFKRWQAAPGPKLSKIAFGRDWRFPITNGSI